MIDQTMTCNSVRPVCPMVHVRRHPTRARPQPQLCRRVTSGTELEDPSDDTIPERHARVTIHHGGVEYPVIRDYLVGPLPTNEKTRLRPLEDIYHNEIKFNARGVNVKDWNLGNFIKKVTEPIKEAMQVLLGGTPNDGIVPAGSGPFSFDGSFRRMWMGWKRDTSGFFMHPLNFFQYVDFSGSDPSLWKLSKLVYDGQVFSNTTEFMDAFHNGELKPVPTISPEESDLSWSTRVRKGPKRDLDDLPGPRAVSFGGVRFRVDQATQYVSWMGWGMYLGFDRDIGLSLWDIRFRNERIVYELAPQDALAQYAGNDPFQSTTAWLDRYFGIGLAVRDMLPGYDCPHEAVFLPATTYSSAGIFSRQKGICVFEQDSGRPITRHLGYEKNEFGAVKGYELVVRSIATLGNYDYLFDYIFHLDGTIEVRVSASGYLQAGYYNPDALDYGTRIWETTMGSLHDHVINFKVDLDVAGTSNSFQKTTLSQEEIEQPFYDEDWGSTTIQQRIDREFIETEDGARVKYQTNFQGGYSIVNQEEKNKWGHARGYSIHPGYSPIHSTLVGSKRLLKNADWAQYNLAVSRRKETEPSSSSMWNMNLPGAPPVDFAQFFDGESLSQEDLVAWINIGMHHLPQAEDAPSTRTNTATSSFFLSPLNYFDHDVSIESMNAILLNMPTEPGAPFTYNDYGVKPLQCVPPAVPPFAYEAMQIFDLEGKEVPAASIGELRKASELYHRIEVEL